VKSKHLKLSARSWTLLRRGAQYSALLLFLVLFVAARRSAWPPALVNLPMRLDPLAALAHALSSHTFLLGTALALLTLALTLTLGRAWCGWLCPLGTLLDLFSPRSHRRRRSLPDTWRSAKYGLLLVLVVSALLGSLTLMLLDPLTLLFRTLTIGVWPAIDQLVTAAETALYRIPVLRPVVSAFDGIVRPAILPPMTQQAFYRATLLFAGILAGLFALNWIAPRFWCRYLCPLGGLLGLTGKAAIVRRRVDERCTACGMCTAACPTATIRPEADYASDPAECTMCLECAAACPQAAIAFTPGRPRVELQPYDPNRRQALAAVGIAVAGVGLMRSSLAARRDSAHLIRPPGAQQEEELLTRCIRCGECMRACPTSGLQPALTEAGAEGLWTPVLVPRLGYCDYACHACGQICPVEAIPTLDLEQKRVQIIGRAYIDRNRCIPWADGESCIVCEEMCPLPEKAIRLEEVQVTGEEGEPYAVQRPVVIGERCIGCGICEYRCPVNGEAAIRVYTPGTAEA
jgi:MauM/NapG family ferredoxin protein